MSSQSSIELPRTYWDMIKLIDVLAGLAEGTGEASYLRGLLQLAEVRFDAATGLALSLNYVEPSSQHDVQFRVTSAGKTFASNRHCPVLTREPDFDVFGLRNATDWRIVQWNLLHGFSARMPNPVDEVGVVSMTDGIEISMMSRPVSDIDAVQRALSAIMGEIKYYQNIMSLIISFPKGTGPWTTLPVDIGPDIDLVRAMRLDNSFLTSNVRAPEGFGTSHSSTPGQHPWQVGRRIRLCTSRNSPDSPKAAAVV